ncbi:MAG: hypothetical protein ACYC0X_08505 [Pirellulaceae bacterium]
MERVAADGKRELLDILVNPVEFDTLFLGYGWFYIDFEEAAEQLRGVLNKHPSWYVPRSLLAGALAHAAMSRNSAEMARDALKEIQAPLQLAGDNPLVLVNCLYVLMWTHEILGDDDLERQRIAADVAARLDKHPQYAVGSLIRAAYYESIGETPKALRAWKDMLTYGRGATNLWPMAALFVAGEIEPKRDLDTIGPEPRIADVSRAYLMAISRDERQRQQARDAFERGKDHWQTWMMRHMLIQIPLLLGDVQNARQQCRQWLSMSASGNHGLEDGSWWDRESIEFLAEVPQSSLDPNSNDSGEQWFANYQRGFLRYEEGDLDAAAHHFAECSPIRRPSRSGWRRYWAVLIEQHIKTLQEHRK